MSELLLISRSHEYELRLKQLLGDDLTSVMGAFLTFGTEVVFRQIGERVPDVVFVGPYLSFEIANELSVGLREHFPGVRVILVHENKTAIDGWLDELGADEVLSPAASDEQILDLIARLVGGEGSTLPEESIAVDEEIADAPDEDDFAHEAADGPPMLERTPLEVPPARVIAVVSPKGGLGKTTIATNLAFGLARIERDAVVLVDADVQFGDVATVLGLNPAHTLPDMVSGLAPRDTMVLKTFLTPHPAGFYVVGGAESPADGDRVSGDQLAHLISQLTDIFHYVIIDTTPGLGEHALTAIEHATDAIMLCSMGVPNLRALRKERAVLDSIDLLPSATQIVLNLADKTSGLNRHDAEQTIGAHIDVVIPRSKAVTLSTNRGVPILQESPRDPASRSLLEIVSGIAGTAGAPAKSRATAKGVA